jgi:hypothetical protein
MLRKVIKLYFIIIHNMFYIRLTVLVYIQLQTNFIAFQPTVYEIKQEEGIKYAKSQIYTVQQHNTTFVHKVPRLI